jgi:hypothetical protein
VPACLMQFHDGSDKEQQVCIKFCANLGKSVIGDESWIYGYDPETRQQSSQWKCPNSPRAKKVRQVKSKVKSMLVIFFDIKGIVHK